MKKVLLIIIIQCIFGAVYSINGTMPIPSSWRSIQNGDWIISFFGNCVVCDNQVWLCKQDTCTGEFLITNGDESRKVNVKPLDKELYSISIGKNIYNCSRIQGQTLDDYPAKDLRTGLKDNQFRGRDSVTVVGWLKDMSPEEKETDAQFSITLENILTDESENYAAVLDSIGRFRLKFPIPNTTQCQMDWKRSHISLPLEPDETYFILVDFSAKQKLVMGRDARLQNEVLATNNSIFNDARFIQYAISDTLSMQAFHALLHSIDVKCDSLLTSNLKQRPNLSSRWINYQKGKWLMDCAFNMGQARFNRRPYKLPEYAEQYARKHYWKNLPRPYSRYFWNTTFFRDYLVSLFFENKQDNDFIHDMLEAGDLSLTKDEIASYEQFRPLNKEKNRLLSLESKVSSAQKVIDQWWKEHAEVYASYTEIKNKYAIDSILAKNKAKYLFLRYAEFFDSVCYNQELKDICMTRYFYQYLRSTKLPLPEQTIQQLTGYIHNKTMLNILLDRSRMYLPDNRTQISGLSRAVSTDSLTNITDGEALMKKLIAPYRGRLVLVDVWGTWCAPCRESLSKSQQEYEALKDYDIVYLYLANRCPEQAWKNAIQEYKVQGPNVVHYNLPSAQQFAIEHYLKVVGYPSFRLFDRNGNLVDENVNPRNLLEFTTFLKQITKN